MSETGLEYTVGRDEDAMSAAGTPNVRSLIREWERCVDRSLWLDRRRVAENTRWAWWDGQDDSGRKLDEKQPDSKPAFPWNGASDTRIRLADEVSNFEVALLENVFDRAAFITEGSTVAATPMAGYVQKRLDWARGGGIPDLDEEVHLLAQYMSTFGWCVAHVLWERRLGRRRVRVTMEQLQGLARASAPGTPLALFPILVADPTTEGQAAELARALYPLFAREQDGGLLDGEVPELDMKRAREIVRALRDEGEAEAPFVEVTRNAPRVVALKPYDEIFFPPETMDLQNARAIFRRDWLNEEQLRARVKDEGWDAKWVNLVVTKTKGHQTGLTFQPASGSPSNLVVQSREQLCEVVWAYHRGVDEDGIESVQCTVISPHLRTEDGYGFSGPVDYGHGEYPFVVFLRERLTRRVYDSRGIPELCMTWQMEKKTQRDALYDRTSLTLVPPLYVTTRNMGKAYRLQPAGQVARDRQGEVEWMEPPRGGQAESFALLEHIESDVDNYFGRPGKYTDPTKANVLQQSRSNRWLNCWKDVFRQVDALMQQYLSDEEWARITGDEGMTREQARKAWQYDWRLRYDVTNLNTETMVAKLKAFMEFVVAGDASGVVDRARLTMLIGNAIDPSIARAVMQDQGGASQKMFRDVREEIAQMALGNEPQLGADADPAAPAKLQFSQQIVANNPKYQQALQSDPQFAELMQKWTKSLEFNVEQAQNRQVGRLGVK